MLELLHIENIAIIERADILFGRGFNALTGETGAGKSIVIDALGAVLGQRTSRELIRTGAEKAFVSATFSAVPADLPGLAENGFTPEEDGTLLLQRELYGDGKNVCRVGGRPVTVAQLKRIGASLLNIHGQHDGQQLLDEEQHLVYLDRFGRVENELAAYCTRYDVMKETRRAIDALKMDEAEKARRVDMLHHQIGELEHADLQEGEEETLLARRNILRNGEKFISAISEADACLNGGDEGLGAVSAIKEAEDALRSLRGLGDEFITLSERLEALRCEAYDLAETIRDKKDEYEFSPQELDAVESRCDQLYRLKKKYGSSVEEMLAYLEKSREELDRIEYADDRAQQLEQTLKKQEKAAREAAQALSDRRHAAAKELEERISRELRELDMPKLRFAIDFQEKDMGEDGVDAVAFLMSANVGEALRPIQKIASGGELSRIMLALKNLSAQKPGIPRSMVFDEIDTGISGRMAQVVAEKMSQIGDHHQVICVTHLPQIAAMADTQYLVCKYDENGATRTEVTRLSESQRAQEIARMVGGAGCESESSVRHAAVMLEEARARKQALRAAIEGK